MQCTKIQYTNFQNMHLCFPIKLKSAADNDNDIALGIITVNNFFRHWIKKIDIKGYGDVIPILALTNTVDIYRYSNELLKTYPKKWVENIFKKLII